MADLSKIAVRAESGLTLYEKIWFTLSPEHPNVAVNISFTQWIPDTPHSRWRAIALFSEERNSLLGRVGVARPAEPSLTSTMNSMPTSSIPQATLRILRTTKTMAGACERFKRLLKSLLPEHQLSLQQKTIEITTCWNPT